MADDVREYQVKVLLSAEEFVAFKAMVDVEGLTQSGYLRRFIKRSISDHCAAQAERAEGTERANFGTWSFKLGDR